jgi:ankyrin repeat protein
MSAAVENFFANLGIGERDRELFMALMSHSEPLLLDAILNLGADVNCRVKYGNTPLHYVSRTQKRSERDVD